MTNNKKIMDLLHFDGLTQAEQMTGTSYKENEGTTQLGMALMLENNKKKREALKEAEDTHFGITFEKFANLVEKKGFVRVYEESFGGNEILCLWADTKKGLLIVAQSFGGNSLNGGTIYGEFRWKEGQNSLTVRCSRGHVKDDIWKFNFDVREGLFTSLDSLETEIETIPIWEDTDRFLWLLNYEEQREEGYDYVANAYQKLSQTPEDVQNMIRFSERPKKKRTI